MASMDFPGLSRLRQMGQRMAQMRRGGMQGDPNNPVGMGVPEFNPNLNAPQNVPGATFMGGGESGLEEEALMGQGTPTTGTPGMPGQTTSNPGGPDLMPRPIPPPSMSMIRDVKPRGLGSYRPAGMGTAGGQRRGML